eukprot:1149533-Pelagomonas_calceolata.AAC.4
MKPDRSEDPVTTCTWVQVVRNASWLLVLIQKLLKKAIAGSRQPGRNGNVMLPLQGRAHSTTLFTCEVQRSVGKKDGKTALSKAACMHQTKLARAYPTICCRAVYMYSLDARLPTRSSFAACTQYFLVQFAKTYDNPLINAQPLLYSKSLSPVMTKVDALAEITGRNINSPAAHPEKTPCIKERFCSWQDSKGFTKARMTPSTRTLVVKAKNWVPCEAGLALRCRRADSSVYVQPPKKATRTTSPLPSPARPHRYRQGQGQDQRTTEGQNLRTTEDHSSTAFTKAPQEQTGTEEKPPKAWVEQEQDHSTLLASKHTKAEDSGPAEQLLV